MVEKGKKQGQKGKTSASEASPVVFWGGERASTPFFFSFSDNTEPGPRLAVCAFDHIYMHFAQYIH